MNDKLVELGCEHSLSDESIRLVLKKVNSKPAETTMVYWYDKWRIFSQYGRYFGHYAAPFSGIPRICFDERPCQLIGNVLAPIPAKPNSTKKEHQEYIRNGVCNVLLAYDIDTGQRYLMVTESKTKADYAQFMKWLLDTHYPNASKIQLVQDNFSTHSYGAFYENLPFDEARKIKNILEFHYTPKHASWLNMAEIEFSALSRQCLDRRIPNIDMLRQEALIWQDERNKKL
ncbi:MAG: IS630 family transposase [Sphingobacteriales bacterium]|nr:IS630 family transposase [Sphingobacteriales bacterium]